MRQKNIVIRWQGLINHVLFCRRKKINRPELLLREYHHPVSGRVYQLSGKMIDWDGKAAHIEYIQDITDRKREEEQSDVLKKSFRLHSAAFPADFAYTAMTVIRFSLSFITLLFMKSWVIRRRISES